MSKNSKEELEWWIHNIKNKNGLSIQKINNTQPALTIHVNASDIAWGVVSKELATTGYWTQEEKEYSISVRELMAICFKIRHKIWRHFFNTLARPRSSNSGYLQPVSTTSTIPTYSWGSEHIGRLHQPSADSESIVRSNATETTIQQTSENVGPSTDRRVCLSSESPAEYVLESTSGPSSSSNRRVQPNLVEEGNVLISTMEIYTSSNSEDQTTKDRRRSPSYPKLANSILVSDASQDATTSNTNDPQGTKVAADRLEVIRKKTKNLGMTEDSVEFLQHSLRANTLKLYNNGWRLWTKWCNDQDPTIDPEKYDTDNVFKFLVAHRNYSVSHLNGIRSSIASTFKILHPNLPPLASQTKIEEFFKAKRNLEIKLPRPGQLGTWDTDITCQYIKENWSDNSTLSLHTLQLKTVALLCLATMGRPRSDIGRLQYQHVYIEEQNQQAKQAHGKVKNDLVALKKLYPEDKHILNQLKSVEKEIKSEKKNVALDTLWNKFCNKRKRMLSKYLLLTQLLLGLAKPGTPVMAAPDRYRLWNRDIAACLNYMHILRELRRNGMVPDRFRRVAVAPTRRRRRMDDQEQPRTRIRIGSSPS
ncbi:hypothetical protein G6F68_006358 [Rhizopus microsporus]|nr:hypothetical protein G6F68_006358 [Rhizopus microsporus]